MLCVRLHVYVSMLIQGRALPNTPWKHSIHQQLEAGALGLALHFHWERGRQKRGGKEEMMRRPGGQKEEHGSQCLYLCHKRDDEWRNEWITVKCWNNEEAGEFYPDNFMIVGLTAVSWLKFSLHFSSLLWFMCVCLQRSLIIKYISIKHKLWLLCGLQTMWLFYNSIYNSHH